MILKFYYAIRPLIPRRIQIWLRRIIAKRKRKKFHDLWPIDHSAGRAPDNWHGWLNSKKFALVLSHDVDNQKGHELVADLLAIEKKLGYRSSFNFVPERYNLSTSLIEQVKKEGFEVRIHGLKHDGKLFKSKSIFDKRAKKINQYIKEWKIEGFTAPAMISNLEWMHALNISNSTSTFDTDPFEPQPNPSKTIFPFIVKDNQNNHMFVELPYTLPQDHALFVILQERDISIWKKKLEWIVKKGGMALLNTHPDYMKINGKNGGLEEYPVQFYVEFLQYIRKSYEGQFWNALPFEISEYVRSTLDNNKIS